MHKVYLGLGSNKGERIFYIENALKEINKIDETVIIKSSQIYETDPWGNKEQNEYLNSVIEIETELDADRLLRELKSIEKKLGRSENKKWTEREIDIDLLFYGEDILINDFMKVPHQEIEKRKFVLVPMNEIAPDFIHPVLNKSISELLQNTNDNLKVNKYTFSNIEK